MERKRIQICCGLRQIAQDNSLEKVERRMKGDLPWEENGETTLYDATIVKIASTYNIQCGGVPCICSQPNLKLLKV